MQDHAPRPLGNNWQNREGRRYFQATNKNKGDEKDLSQWMVNWSMLMLICRIYIIYILATKKHTCIIAWSTKFFTKAMHFLYHSYCYAVSFRVLVVAGVRTITICCPGSTGWRGKRGVGVGKGG